MKSARRNRDAVVILTVMVTTASLPRLAYGEEPSGAVFPSPPAREGGRSWKTPALTFGLQGGVTYFTEETPFGTAKGIGRALAPGPNIGLRASFEIFPWLALDGRGTFTNNEGNNYVGLGSLSTVGGFGAVRLTLPLGRLRPYAMAGFGGYGVEASGTSTALTSGTYSAFVLGLGALIRLERHFDVGVEYQYVHLNGETLSTNENADGGDPSNLSFFGQYRL